MTQFIGELVYCSVCVLVALNAHDEAAREESPLAGAASLLARGVLLRYPGGLAAHLSCPVKSSMRRHIVELGEKVAVR